jgi:hypothetical protein
LRQSFNTEGFEFLDLVDEVREDARKCIEQSGGVVSSFLKQKVNTIIENYVELKSRRELNISAKDRQQLLDAAKKLESNGLEQLMLQFKNVRHIVEGEMESDVMPRFIRSSIWLNTVNTKGKNWLDKVGMLKKAMEMEYTDEDFMGHYVEDRDIDFMRFLSQDSYEWKLLGWDKSQQIMAFRSDTIAKYFPKTQWVQNGASVSKYVGILPFPFDVVEHYMLHAKYVNEFDANVTNQRTVQYYTYEQLKEKYPDKEMKSGRTVCVMLYDVKFPFPLSKRIYCVNSSAMYDPVTQESIAISKPCYHESLKEYNLKKTLPLTDFQIYSIKKLDDQRTMYYQLHIANVGSNTGNKLSKLVMFNRGKQLSTNIAKFMKEKKGKPVPEHDPEDGLMKPLLDHKKYLQSQTTNNI